MNLIRGSSLAGVSIGVLLFGVSPLTRADTIASANGAYTAGMYQSDGTNGGVSGKNYGILSDSTITGIGLQNSKTLFDGFAADTPRDAYGVVAGPNQGYVDLQNHNISPGNFGGVQNIIPGSYVNNGTSATVTTFLTDNNGAKILQITQVFSFLGPGNVLQDAITLTNVTTPTSSVFPQGLPVQFRRVDAMWVNNGIGQPNNIVTVDPTQFPVTSAAPLSQVPGGGNISESPNPAVPFVNPTSGGTFDEPHNELGGAFNLDLGMLYAYPLPPGFDPNSFPQSKTFNIYFADGLTGQTEAGLRAELNSLGVNYIISDNNSTGGPFVAAIGTQIIPGIPEPTTLALLSLGLAGLAGARWRRSRVK
jgi:hypothetical protein